MVAEAPGPRAAPDAQASAFGIARELHQRLDAWVADVLGDVALCRQAPGSGAWPAGRCIGLYLMEFAPVSGARSGKAPPLQFSVRVLVTAWGSEASATHDDLCALAFSALDTPSFEVDFEPLPAAVWAACGTAPRPSFSIHVPLRRARTPVLATAVRTPPVLSAAPMTVLSGTVLGPSDVPVANARVELLTLGLSTLTDGAGRFGFAGVPVERALRLTVSARGVQQDFACQAVAAGAKRLQLRIDL